MAQNHVDEMLTREAERLTQMIKNADTEITRLDDMIAVNRRHRDEYVESLSAVHAAIDARAPYGTEAGA